MRPVCDSCKAAWVISIALFVFLLSGTVECAPNTAAVVQKDTLRLDARKDSTGHDSALARALPGSLGQVAVAYDTIAGPLPDTVKSKGKPYLVVGDIEVPVGKSVTIEPGTVFLFKTFTGLHVLGRLSVQGTKDSPVVFTSENDRGVNRATTLLPNPYDWNGIYVHSDAVGSSFTHCKVLYSVYGIVSETKFIKLNPVVLENNGKSNLVIQGKEEQVTDKPFIYMYAEREPGSGLAPGRTANLAASKRAVLRYGGIVVGMAATVGGVYSGLLLKRDWTSLSAISTDNPTAIKGSNGEAWLSRQAQRNNDIYYTAGCGVIALLGYIGFGWSFTF